ncbi:MAG TPA: site-2 protease family protein [Caldithrix sp.]|nr:site-2 protease family protein [Caldithrix sp.]
MNDDLLREFSMILGPVFRIDRFSDVTGEVVFYAPEHLIADDDISRIIVRLMSIGYLPRIQKEDGNLFVKIVPQQRAVKKSRVWINLLLFVLTIGTTMMAGALLLGKDIFTDISNIWYGWRYSFAVLFILTSHEMGHYLAARHHGMRVTLPFYIPLPLPGFNFCTLGAFIKIKSPIPNRRALLDVGASGPLAGFVASLVFLIIGYSTLPDFNGIVAYVEQIHPWDMHGQGINLVLGKSLLFSLFNDFLAGGRLPMNEVYHFPFIFAGWIGLLVTAINLIPIGQLDGGHILYSLIGKKARLAGLLSFSLLLLLNFVLIIRYLSFVWVLWILLIFLLIGFRHPPTLQEEINLTPGRRYVGWLSLALFLLCFTPLPIYIG